ncbi:MAG: hypothetical protein U0R50_00465 [Gaiellales bacterium]
MWGDFVNHLLWWLLSGLIGIGLGWMLWGNRGRTHAMRSRDGSELRAALAARDAEIADLRRRLQSGGDPGGRPRTDV